MCISVPFSNYKIFKGEKTSAEYPIEERIPTWAKPYEKLAKHIIQIKWSIKLSIK